MTQGFEDWYFKQNHLGIEPIDHARESYKAEAESRQEEVSKLQAEIDELKAINDQLLIENISYRDKKWDNNESYSEGQASMYNIKQKEIDELRKRLAEYERENYKLVPVEPLIPNSEELKL